MLARPFSSGVWVSIALAGLAHAHMAPFDPSMYAFNGTDPSVVNYNNGLPVDPLYQMTYDQYWGHRFDGCWNYPPPEGTYLDVPAGGSMTLQITENRQFTTYGKDPSPTDWGDGKSHSDDYSVINNEGYAPTTSGCISSPNLHAQNYSMTAGSALAISHVSSIEQTSPNNTVIFSVASNSPWKRLTTYQVPSGMPACPDGGCICFWLWIANGCGQRNEFMYPYKCMVITDSTPAKTIGSPKPAAWCEDDTTKCVTGPKQPIIYDQLEGNNIVVNGNDLSGERKTPGYNTKCGFQAGAQNDIFVDSSTSSVSGTQASTASAPTSSLPAGSGTPSTIPTSSLPAGSGTPSTTPTVSLPAGSGTPALPSSAPPSSLPSGSGPPVLPSITPTSGFPAGSGTPALPSAPGSCLPAGSSTPALPSSAPPSSLPAGSGTPTNSNPPASSSTPSNSPGTRKRFIGDFSATGPGHTSHSKRMATRRGRKNVF